jgi:hypothetical protein
MSTNKRFRIVLTSGLVLALVVAWMHGKGTLLDPRSDDTSQLLIAAKAGFDRVTHDPDLVTSQPAALPLYRLAFDAKGAERGKLVFNRKASGGFYHDGRFPTLGDVVKHYDDFLKLGLSEAETKDLVEYLKSL